MIVDELEPGAIFVEPIAEGERQFGLRAKRYLENRKVPSNTPWFGAKTAEIGRDLDLFFAAPAVPSDLLALDTIKDWRSRSRVAVCFLQELWISEFDVQLKGVRRVLDQFDHIFVAFHHTAEALSRLLGRKIEYMPLGIDAELWNPYQGAPKPRWIDACAVGNMHPETHASLWDWAEKTGRYYSFTTTGSAPYAVSHRQHRQALAQTLKCSKAFFCYMAKRDVTIQRGTQQEFGPRYFEGAGAGSLILGDTIATDSAFRDYMDWDGAVIEAPFKTKDIPAILEELEKDTGWVEDLRRRNVAQCLTRHDHLNRWDLILQAAGLPATPAMEERRQRLQMQANVIGATILTTAAASKSR